MKFCIAFLALAVASTLCTASVFPAVDSAQKAVVLSPQPRDIFENSRKVIEQMVENLRKLANEAGESVTTFTNNIQNQAVAMRDRVMSDIQNLRARIAEAMDNVSNRLVDSGVAVIDCIASHRGDANAIFNRTLTKTMSCVDQRIEDVSQQVRGLGTTVQSTIDFGDEAIGAMRKCTQDNDGFLNTGSCLGAVAIRTELKAIIQTSQIALKVGRVNLGVATLPASLEVCAGTHLVELGMETARSIMEIGSCSATTVFNTMTGNIPMVLSM